MTKDSALRMALEALEYEPIGKTSGEKDLKDQAITAIKEALAQPEKDIPKIGCVNHDCDKCKAHPEQEPVAWRFRTATQWLREPHWRYLNTLEGSEGLLGVQPLYTTPPQRTWVELTDKEIKALAKRPNDIEIPMTGRMWIFVGELMEKLKEKNT